MLTSLDGVRTWMRENEDDFYLPETKEDKSIWHK